MAQELAGENCPLGGADAPMEGVERNGGRGCKRNADSRPVLRCAEHQEEVHRVLASVMGLRGAESFSVSDSIRTNSTSAATMKPMIDIS